MIKITATCDYCGHKWEADRHGDGALHKFRTFQLDGRTICLSCAQSAGELLVEKLLAQGIKPMIYGNN